MYSVTAVLLLATVYCIVIKRSFHGKTKEHRIPKHSENIRLQIFDWLAGFWQVWPTRNKENKEKINSLKCVKECKSTVTWSSLRELDSCGNEGGKCDFITDQKSAGFLAWPQTLPQLLYPASRGLLYPHEDIKGDMKGLCSLAEYNY